VSVRVYSGLQQTRYFTQVIALAEISSVRCCCPSREAARRSDRVHHSEHARGKSGPHCLNLHHRLLPPSTFCVAIRSKYKTQTSPDHVSVSVSRSYACDLAVEWLVSSHPTSLYYRDYSYQHLVRCHSALPASLVPKSVPRDGTTGRWFNNPKQVGLKA